MKPAPFEYHSPTSLDEATQLLSELGEDARVIAGGQSLVPILAMRLGRFEHLIDLRRIDEMRGVSTKEDAVIIGAMTRQAEIEHDRMIAASVPLLVDATRYIGHFQIRNRGTLGGSLAHADPAAEYPAVAVALDARLDLASVRGRRSVPAGEFFTSNFTTAIAPDEILVAASFPRSVPGCGFAIEEIARRAGDFALAGAVIAIRVADEMVVDVRAVWLAMATTPYRATSFERDLAGTWVEHLHSERLVEAAEAAAATTNPPADIHATATYRRRTGAVALRRATQKALAQAVASTESV